MIHRMYSAGIFGMEGMAVPVEVQLLIANNPRFHLIGLPDTSIRESRARVQAAITHSGFKMPFKTITVNLGPAGVKKEGTAFDLAIALAILATSEQIVIANKKRFVILGELSLSGRVHRVSGILPILMSAKEEGFTDFILPRENLYEAMLINNINLYPVNFLEESVEILQNENYEQKLLSLAPPVRLTLNNEIDFSDVRGQESVKRALEVAVAGSHNILMIGPPGAGKTMLARRIPTMLPKMTEEEILETTKIYSISGLLNEKNYYISQRPFRSPHHTASDIAIVGGGRFPKAGEVSLAHNGILFLDEFPEFRKNVLQVLRQPLEDGIVTISRASGTVTFPSRFMLVAAMNPCPCGHLGDTNKVCTCHPLSIQKYYAQISGPIMDRIDIHIEVPALSLKQIENLHPSESSSLIRERVQDARNCQLKRFESSALYANAHMNIKQIRKYCKLDDISHKILRQCFDKLGLSVRAYAKILKIARTIADLDQEENILPTHITEAIQYRTLDRWENRQSIPQQAHIRKH